MPTFLVFEVVAWNLSLWGAGWFFGKPEQFIPWIYLEYVRRELHLGHMHIWPSYICFPRLIGWKIVRFGRSVSSLWASLAGRLLCRCWCTYFPVFVRWLLIRMCVFRVWSWLPSDVGIESGRNLVMLFSANNGHVDRLFFRMAFKSVLFVGLPMLRCKKLRVSIMVPSGSFELICGSTCC